MSEALQKYNKDPEREQSHVRDFMMFCVERGLPGTWPIFPVTVAKLTRFMFFIIRFRRLSGGWKDAQKWRRAIVRYMAPVQVDPFLGVGESVEERVRAAFTRSVAQRRFVKAPMTMALFNGIWDLLDTGTELHELERTLFLLYQIGGFRAATFTLSSDKRGWNRLVKIMNVSFYNDADGCRAAFVTLPETKTTAEWQPVGHVIRARPDGNQSRCAVHRLEALINSRLAAGARPTDAIFINPRNRRPYSKNVFNSHLKTYIDQVASRYVLGQRLPRRPSAYISAISFRRGTLSRLAGAGVAATQIASFADHTDIGSQLHYICETYEAPGVTAAHLYAGF